jgi:dipeptidyl aminopeptidase/acylaminoacyl peptidase
MTSLPWRKPRKLTELHPGWGDIRRAQLLTTKWRSRDDRFDIEGVVILPPDWQPGKRLPTLLYMPGGPSMPRMGFMMDEPLYPFLVFAARGWAVFIPNCRGRGGFGMEMRYAIPRKADPMPGPFADSMAGVDDLIARGIADPDKLAFSGFSFGGRSRRTCSRIRRASRLAVSTKVSRTHFDWRCATWGVRSGASC